MFDWFLRSVLMEEAGGGEGAGGGGDSTALATTTVTDLATTGDGTGDGADGTGTAVAAGDDSAPAAIYEGGRVSQGVSRAFRKLETANPTLRRTFRTALDALDTVGRLRTMLGDKPFDKIKQYRKLESEVAAYAYVNAEGKRIDGITAIRELNDDVKAQDTMYETANPLLIESMTESPLGKFAFTKLFPHVVAKTRALAPKMYTRWLGAQIVNALEKLEMVTAKDGEGKVTATDPIDMPFRLRRVFTQLPPLDVNNKFVGGQITADQQHAIHSDLAMIYSWIDAMRAWANATPEDLTPAKADENAAAMVLAQQKADVALDKAWTAAKKAECIPLLDAEIRRQTARLNLDATAIADITARARKGSDDRRNKQPDDQGRRIAFFKARDMNGFLAYHRQAVVDHGPEAVTDAIAASGHRANRKATATQTAGTTAAGAGTGQQQQQQASGTVRRLTPDEAAKLGGVNGTRWMKPAGIGTAPGTTQAMVMERKQMMRKGNPLNLPEGTVVQFP